MQRLLGARTVVLVGAARAPDGLRARPADQARVRRACAQRHGEPARRRACPRRQRPRRAAAAGLVVGLREPRRRGHPRAVLGPAPRRARGRRARRRRPAARRRRRGGAPAGTARCAQRRRAVDRLRRDRRGGPGAAARARPRGALGRHAAGRPGVVRLLRRRCLAADQRLARRGAARPPARLGLFCQSAPMAVPILASVANRNLGMSSFVSAGHRADVSGNDLMQFWEEDPGHGGGRAVPGVDRQPAQVLPDRPAARGGQAGRRGHRRASRGRSSRPGHAVRPTRSPRRTIEEVFRQSGRRPGGQHPRAAGHRPAVRAAAAAARAAGRDRRRVVVDGGHRGRGGGRGQARRPRPGRHVHRGHQRRRARRRPWRTCTRATRATSSSSSTSPPSARRRPGSPGPSRRPRPARGSPPPPCVLGLHGVVRAADGDGRGRHLVDGPGVLDPGGRCRCPGRRGPVRRVAQRRPRPAGRAGRHGPPARPADHPAAPGGVGRPRCRSG